MNATSAFLITFAPVAAALLVVAAADAFAKRALAVWAAVIGLGAGGVAGLWFGWNVAPGLALGSLRFGGLYATICGLVLALAALSLAGGIRELLVRAGGGSSALLVVVSASGAALAAVASDLVMLLLALETAAIGAYALVSLSHDRRSAEGAMKYLIQGAISTAVFVMAVAVLSGLVSPTATYVDVATAIAGAAAQPAVAGSLLLLLALAFKVSAAPVHAWAPDAYSTAPEESGAYMAGALKLGALTALVVVFATLLPTASGLPIGGVSGDLTPAIMIFGALSIAVGSFAALKQTSYTRMLAYAGVAQVGYSLLAVATGSIFAALIQASAYAIATTGAFVAAATFRRLRPSWDGTVDGLAGLGRRHAVVGTAVALLMASLGGIPPLVGFWGKFQALGSIVYAAGTWSQLAFVGVLAWVCVAVGIIGAIVALAYYGAVMRSLFFGEEPDAEVPTEQHDGRGAGAVVIAIAVAVTVLGVVPLFVDVATIVVGFRAG